MPRGALIVALDFTDCQEDEFHDWYDLEHLPERQRIPGFGVCERWISVANPKIAMTSRLSPASLNQAESVSKISRLGRPEAKPNASITNARRSP